MYTPEEINGLKKFFTLEAGRKWNKMRATGKTNFYLFSILTAFIVVFPIIPETDKDYDILLMGSTVLASKYDMMNLFFLAFIILFGMNFALSIINIVRKIEYIRFLKIIEKLR